MHPRDFARRTKEFALAAVNLVRSLPRDVAADIMGRQLLHASTSVAANYRAACRARSRREFVAKLGIVLEEADESKLWLELLSESGTVQQDRVRWLRREAEELIALTAASVATARRSLGGRR